MARPRGPLGNAPRDLEDDFVGVPAEKITTGPPPRWPPNPKKVKGNTFHSKVTGNTSLKRADRAGHYRRGGWVKGYARGGDIGERETEPTPDEISRRQIKRPLLGYKRGGEAIDEENRAMHHDDGKFARGGAAKRAEGGGTEREKRPQLKNPPFRRQLTEPARQRFGYSPGEFSRMGEEEQFRRDTGRYPATDSEVEGIYGSRDEDERKRGGAVKYAAGGRLTAKARQSLPSSDFALPGKGKGPKGAGSGSYPIPDRSHAANALARSSGKPVAAEVRRKVKAKYPDMKVSG